MARRFVAARCGFKRAWRKPGQTHGRVRPSGEGSRPGWVNRRNPGFVARPPVIAPRVSSGLRISVGRGSVGKPWAAVVAVSAGKKHPFAPRGFSACVVILGLAVCPGPQGFQTGVVQAVRPPSPRSAFARVSGWAARFRFWLGWRAKVRRANHGRVPPNVMGRSPAFGGSHPCIRPTTRHL